MIIISREMKTKETSSDRSYGYSQASFNSNGNITLRNYNCVNKDKDEIIILNGEETAAIINLFKQLQRHNMLPF